MGNEVSTTESAQPPIENNLHLNIESKETTTTKREGHIGVAYGTKMCINDESCVYIYRYYEWRISF